MWEQSPIHYMDRFCIVLSVRMVIDVMSLRLKTQNGVLGRSAGASSGMTSGLLSHNLYLYGDQTH